MLGMPQCTSISEHPHSIMRHCWSYPNNYNVLLIGPNKQFKPKHVHVGKLTLQSDYILLQTGELPYPVFYTLSQKKYIYCVLEGGDPSSIAVF